MYASQNINTDPAPYQVWTRMGDEAFYAGNGSAIPFDDGKRFTKHAPRSYYDNDPNPLLIEFREHLAGLIGGWRIAPSEARHWLELLKRDPGMNDSCLWGEWMADGKTDHIEHLRKVLTRIAAL